MPPQDKKIKSRRNFINTSLKLGALIPLINSPLISMAKKPVHPLKILILGGTSFLGPHQIAYALGRGHAVSIFTRGKTQPTIYKKLFKEVEYLTGDREDNLEALKGRKWDAVIDNSGRRVKWTEDSAQLLKDSVNLYLYTSSTGVYYPYLEGDIKEDRTLQTVVPENITEDQKLEYDYGVMKTNSEVAARKAFGANRTIIVRPTYMMGPADRTDRFTYWPVRLSRGGEVLVPGKAADPVQYIDVRDVANWMIRLIENGTTGTFNAVGPASPTGMHQFVYGAHAAFSSPVSFVMVDDYDFLEKQELVWIIPWILPAGNNYATARVNNQHSIQHGLTYRPLAQSVRDIYEWWHSDAVSEERREKMLSEQINREDKILRAWKVRKR